MLLNSGVGQGLFFAGLKHVAIQVIASFSEDKIVTTNPEELLAQSAVNQEFETSTETEPTQAKVEPLAPTVSEPVPAPVVEPQPAVATPAPVLGISAQSQEEAELAKGFTENSDAVLAQPVVEVAATPIVAHVPVIETVTPLAVVPSTAVVEPVVIPAPVPVVTPEPAIIPTPVVQVTAPAIPVLEPIVEAKPAEVKLPETPQETPAVQNVPVVFEEKNSNRLYYLMI